MESSHSLLVGENVDYTVGSHLGRKINGIRMDEKVLPFRFAEANLAIVN